MFFLILTLMIVSIANSQRTTTASIDYENNYDESSLSDQTNSIKNVYDDDVISAITVIKKI
jgi:hypothetical protein